LLRKGRFDEVFFVDLPTRHERADILRLHITLSHSSGKDRFTERVGEDQGSAGNRSGGSAPERRAGESMTASQPRDTHWELMYSWWVLTTLPLVTGWLGFIYIGVKVSQMKWIAWAFIYMIR